MKKPGNAAGERVDVGRKVNSTGNKTRVEYLSGWVCNFRLILFQKLTMLYNNKFIFSI